MFSYLTTLFLGKPPGGSLLVLSVHSFASNLQLALLESGKIFFHERMCRTRGSIAGPVSEADTLPTELPLCMPWSN